MFFSRTLSVGRWKCSKPSVLPLRWDSQFMDYDYVIVIIPKTRLPSAEPIINQQGFRSCSIAPFFWNQHIPLGRHVTTGKRWHRVLETTRKSSAGASRSTPQFHVKNGMTRWMKTGNSSEMGAPFMVCYKKCFRGFTDLRVKNGDFS